MLLELVTDEPFLQARVSALPEVQPSQLEAEATSLLAVVVVAAVGAWRQQGYGNLTLRDGVLVGALAPLGVAVGTVVANSVPERALELGFATVQLYFAYRLVRRWAGGRSVPPTEPVAGASS